MNQTSTPTELATAAVAALFVDFDVAAAEALLAPDYIQHNPGVPTGAAPVLDFDKTEANKALVTEFAQSVLIGGAFDRIGEYIVGGDAYLQHNPLFGDGLQALGEAFAAFTEAGNAIAYNEVHQIIGQGNFVLLMSGGTFGDAPTACYDLFRLEDGRIVEHWDVIQEIPAEMAHDNSKF